MTASPNVIMIYRAGTQHCRTSAAAVRRRNYVREQQSPLRSNSLSKMVVVGVASVLLLSKTTANTAYPQNHANINRSPNLRDPACSFLSTFVPGRRSFSSGVVGRGRQSARRAMRRAVHVMDVDGQRRRRGEDEQALAPGKAAENTAISSIHVPLNLQVQYNATYVAQVKFQVQVVWQCWISDRKFPFVLDLSVFFVEVVHQLRI